MDPERRPILVTLRWIWHEKFYCDCLERALSKVEGVSNVIVEEKEVRLWYQGPWKRLYLIENAVVRMRIKATLMTPARFVLRYSADRHTDPKILLEGLRKVPGIVHAYADDGEAVAIGSIAGVDPRSLADAVHAAGFRFEAIKSHRFATFLWDGEADAAQVQAAFQGLVGVLRVDLEPESKKVSVFAIADTASDATLKAAAKQAGFQLKKK